MRRVGYERGLGYMGSTSELPARPRLRCKYRRLMYRFPLAHTLFAIDLLMMGSLSRL